MMKMFTFWVVLTFIVCGSKTGYLKDVRVVYRKEKISKPADSVQRINGLNADINSGFEGEFVWLVPVWTNSLRKGASSIEVEVHKEPNKAYDDLAKGTGGDFRYLKMVRDLFKNQQL